MPEQRKGNRLFWAIAVLSYAIVVSATFARIYVYHAYPVYYAEEEIPDMAGEVWNAVSNLGL